MKKRYPPCLFLLLAFFFIHTSSAFGQGHDCASATVVTTNTIYMVDTVWTPGGFVFGDCPLTSVGTPWRSVWYVFTAPYSGPIEITSCFPGTFNPDTRLSVFQGSCEPSACIGADADFYCNPSSLASLVVFDAMQGEQYYIQWDNGFMPYDTVQFQWVINTCESIVSGTAFYDLNSNGIKESSEPVFNGFVLRDGQTTTQSGNDPYAMCSPFGTYELTLAAPPIYHTVVPASHAYTTSEQDPSVSGLGFALQPIPGMLDGAVHLYGAFPWIGNNTPAWIHYENLGTEAIDVVLEFHLDPLLEFVSADVAPSSIVNNTISWDLGTLQPYEEATIQLEIFTPITVAWNVQVTNWALLTVAGNDVDGTNNFDEWKPLVVAAYDPNDKQVTTEVLTPDEVADRTKLGYTIRFQNTGNAPAVNVVIRDTIDAGLDLTTFDMISATHDYQLSINGNELVWLFPNIMLPDSTSDFDGSIGAFHYRIAMHEDLLLGDQVQNEAHIFFDFAVPITTNTVVTEVSMPQRIGELGAPQQFLIHPVPNAGPFNIRWLGGPMKDARITITDGIGREIQSLGPIQIEKAQDLHVDLSAHPNGVYLVSITSADVVARGRVVLRR